MARNRRDVDADVKREQIERVASELFLQEGYDAVSMATVAKAAGVAPNTLYWYFANKDDLLVATLDRVVNKALADLAAMGEQPLGVQLRWLLSEFQQASKLVSTVHARVDRSDVVNAWHDRFHAMLDQMLVQRLMDNGMSRAKASVMATVGTYAVEGLLSHKHTAQHLDKVVGWLAGDGKL